MVLWGPENVEAVFCRKFRLTLMQSARYPAAAACSSEAPGIVFTWNASVEMVPGYGGATVSHTFFHGIGQIF